MNELMIDREIERYKNKWMRWGTETLMRHMRRARKKEVECDMSEREKNHGADEKR